MSIHHATESALLTQIGQSLERRRLDLGLTQAELAERAGVGKRTVERIEAGASVQLSTLLRLLRVLELLPGLDLLFPEPSPRPMDLLRRKGSPRKRAPGRRQKKPAKQVWTWGDEE